MCFPFLNIMQGGEERLSIFVSRKEKYQYPVLDFCVPGYPGSTVW